jgi:hypothetical protein
MKQTAAQVGAANVNQPYPDAAELKTMNDFIPPRTKNSGPGGRGGPGSRGKNRGGKKSREEVLQGQEEEEENTPQSQVKVLQIPKEGARTTKKVHPSFWDAYQDDEPETNETHTKANAVINTRNFPRAFELIHRIEKQVRRFLKYVNATFFLDSVKDDLEEIMWVRFLTALHPFKEIVPDEVQYRSSLFKTHAVDEAEDEDNRSEKVDMEDQLFKSCQYMMAFVEPVLGIIKKMRISQ